MTWTLYFIGAALYTMVVFFAGEKYGNRLEEDARRELQNLRGRLADRIKGAGPTTGNPQMMTKGGRGGQ